MCAGAIINSRIAEVRYGAREDKSGCCGSVLNLFEERFNHKPRIYGGLLAEESRALLDEFFRHLR
jgi:tRNA(adenine34) deaminase